MHRAIIMGQGTVWYGCAAFGLTPGAEGGYSVLCCTRRACASIFLALHVVCKCWHVAPWRILFVVCEGYTVQAGAKYVP